MDFVVGLPRTKANHDAIWIIIDRANEVSPFSSDQRESFFGKVSPALFKRDSRTTRSSSINCI